MMARNLSHSTLPNRRFWMADNNNVRLKVNFLVQTSNFLVLKKSMQPQNRGRMLFDPNFDRTYRDLSGDYQRDVFITSSQDIKITFRLSKCEEASSQVLVNISYDPTVGSP